MSKPDDSGRLEEVGALVGLPGAFALWCSENHVDDLPAFLHALIDGSVPGPSRVWADLQVALLQARQLRSNGDGDAAIRSIEKFLNRPGFPPRDAQDRRARAIALAGGLGTEDPTTPTARGELIRAGGLAGARYLADRLTDAEGREVSVRQVRDRLRHTHGAVRKVGGGYYAVREYPAVPVAQWLDSWLHAHGPKPFDHVVRLILHAYPHGDEAAVQAWLHQELGSVRMRGGVVEARSKASVA